MVNVFYLTALGVKMENVKSANLDSIITMVSVLALEFQIGLCLAPVIDEERETSLIICGNYISNLLYLLIIY